MLHSKSTILSILLSGAALLSSCSFVKEDRGECPCTLNINMDAFLENDAIDDTRALVSVQSAALLREEADLLEHEGAGLDVEVQRRRTPVSVAVGCQNASVKGDTLAVRAGRQWDPLFACAGEPDCNGDLCSWLARPHKQYCTVHLVLQHYKAGDEYPYDLCIKADCNAMRLLTLRPVTGEYSVLVDPSAAGVFDVRLPRQKENSVLLEMYAPNARRVYDRSDRVNFVNVGEQMEARGYDWGKEDLDDVYVTIDAVTLQAAVTIIAWDSSNINIEI